MHLHRLSYDTIGNSYFQTIKESVTGWYVAAAHILIASSIAGDSRDSDYGSWTKKRPGFPVACSIGFRTNFYTTKLGENREHTETD
jgi:hypothetical protein